MFGSKTILIVDVNAYNGVDLSLAIEERDGCVAGPVGTIEDVRTILDSLSIAAAVVDCDIDGSEAADVVMLLAGEGIPTVVQTIWPPPPALQTLDGRTTVLLKPVDAALLLDTLLVEIGRADRSSNEEEDPRDLLPKR
jgi:hypothetical protein